MYYFSEDGGLRRKDREEEDEKDSSCRATVDVINLFAECEGSR